MIDGPIVPLVGPIDEVLKGPQYPRPDKKAIALRVGFHRNIEHFAHSLAFVGMSLALNTIHVTQYVANCVVRIQIIFFSVLHEPPFNPRSQAFIDKIKRFEDQVPVLGERLKKQDDKIWYAHALLKDLTELKKLFNDVTKTESEIGSYLETLGRCTSDKHPMFIRLTALKKQYDDLEKDLNDYLNDQTSLIANKFENILNIFLEANADVPKDMLNELKGIDSIIRSIFRLSRDMSFNLSDKLYHLQDFDPNAQVQDEKIKLLRLRNYRNSCYIASVMQSLLCVDEVCQKFRQPLERANFKSDEEFKKKLAIQKELFKFTEAQSTENKVQPRSHLEYFLYAFSLGDRDLDQDVAPSVRRLRENIFKAELHGELKGQANLGAQLDAASFMELMTEGFLKEETGITYREYTKVDNLPGLEFAGPVEELNILQVPFSQKPGGGVYGKLSNLVNAHLRKNSNTNKGRLFNPTKGQVTDAEKAMTWAKIFGLADGENFSVEQQKTLLKLADVLEESKYRNDSLKIGELFDELQNKQEDWEKVSTDLVKACHLLGADEEPDDLKSTFAILCQKIMASFHILEEKDEFTQWTRLKSLPDTLVLHFKRFDTKIVKDRLVGFKVDSPIEFPGIERLDPKHKIEANTPELGVLDLTRYYDAPEGQPQDARYEIVSYVIHSGTLGGGHYTACVKKTNDEGQDTYWYCDDVSGNKQITREEFMRRQDAYMIVCKRLPPKPKKDAPA